MAKKPTLHPYADKQTFERLMLLIATILRYPGVGCREEELETDEHHNALEQVQTRLLQVAQDYGIELPNYSTPTLRKDLETLRRYGILEHRMYRWGYYLGTGVMNQEELHLALNALASQAKYQGEPHAKRTIQVLSKRLRGLDLELNGQFFYPVKQQLNRAIVYTDTEEAIAFGENQDNLFDKWDLLVEAISQGQAVELSRSTDPYGRGNIGRIQVWPLQLIYHDIAWYLIYEYCHTQHLAIGRVNRFQNYCKILPNQQRNLEFQQKRLQDTHKLIENGWGLYLGEPAEQQAELLGELKLETVKVRFFPDVISFIEEGKRRHPQQKTKVYRDSTTGKPKYLNYEIKLPPRSLGEFSLWIFRHMDNALVLHPPALMEKHKQAAVNLAARYQSLPL